MHAGLRSKAPFRLAAKEAQVGALWRKPAVAKEFAYLKQACAENLVDRMDDILRPLDRAADLSLSGGYEMALALKNAGRFETMQHLDQVVLNNAQVNVNPDALEGLSSVRSVVANDWTNICPGALEEGSYDLVTSNLSLHWMNDIDEALKQIRKALKPDGVFLGSIFGGDTLHELRASMAIAEQEREGGVSQHVSPMLPFSDVSGLLSGAGLKLVTVDTAQIQVDFDNAFSLMRHLWWMGESNACSNRRDMVSRETMLATAAIYDYLYGYQDENDARVVPATFSIIFMIGWAPHESQPLPLKPGQGQVSLTKLGKGGAT